MKFEKIVEPSSQLYSTLPGYITEQYPRFVEFMQSSLEANERQGFGQDILQNLEKYRDFDFYKGKLTEYDYLDENLEIDEEEYLVVANSFGFPDENGVVYLAEPEPDSCSIRYEREGEVVLYRYKEGNRLYGLQRGASATIDLGSFSRDSVYKYTKAHNHVRGTKVYNVSGLFMQSMLETIHETFADSVDSRWIGADINHGTLLERFKDFFQSKGSKLGIKALFKFIFQENDVNVFYPGDRMIDPSSSTWTETFLVRVVPLPRLLVTPDQNYIQPDRLVNRELQLKSYNDLLDDTTKNVIYGRAICDFVSSYEFGDTTQYEFYIQKVNIKGTFPANPFTNLTRNLDIFGSGDDRQDVTTITVETTLGFPDKGVIFIGQEGIYYEEKTFNQFLKCKRGFINVEVPHKINDRVYGPYYIEGIEEYTDEYGDTRKLISRSWPLGLVDSVNIEDPGLLHLPGPWEPYGTGDEVVANGPGRVDPREPALTCFTENYQDRLISQASVMPYMADCSERTWGPSGVYFDNDFVYVTSTNFPNYTFGTFSKDFSVGPDMQAVNAVHIFPRFENKKENRVSEDENGVIEYYFHDKGTREIGVFADGVPAFSNVSPERIFQGCITKYEIVSGGYGYGNPTLLVNNTPVKEVITLDTGKEGRVVSITTFDKRNYKDIPPLPTVEITGGKDAEVELTFDRYGRVIAAEITNGGRYYADVPTIKIVDTSRRGKGGALVATVADDKVATIEILNPGIDYNPNTTKAVVSPRGSGAVVVPFVQYYQFDRVGQVNNNPFWNFDEGGGFLWESGDNTHRYFGYVSYPTKLFDDLTVAGYINTEEAERIITQDANYIIVRPGNGIGVNNHSPLLGYAYDGVPIYGPYLFKNGKDDSEGYKQGFSGWTTYDSRSEVIPSGGDVQATDPPSEQKYPMGTFVEDYYWDPAKVTRTNRILDEEYRNIRTEPDLDYLAVALPIPEDWFLNQNNAIKCNTPEYPAELYPDGVWIYVCTTTGGGEPAFPYIIGKTFEKRPISQNLTLLTSDDPRPGLFIIYNPYSVYREFPIEFDFTKVERHRNNYLTSTKEELKCEIGETSLGGVSEIIVVDGKPIDSKVGDGIWIDNYDSGGTGAGGLVSHVEGENVISGEGFDITTYTISHHQRLNLSTNTTPPENPLDPDGYFQPYMFVENSIITTSSNAEAIVINYDIEKNFLDVYTYTKNLIQQGDSFYDERGYLITLGVEEDYQFELFELNEGEILVTERGELFDLDLSQQQFVFHRNNEDYQQRKVLFANNKPVNEDLTPGDLWWSNQNGKLYILYNDGDSLQWAVTQPIGMRPYWGALDDGIGTDAYTPPSISNPQEEQIVCISTRAPSERADGSPSREGDLWWSNHTGILYIWTGSEWVCTDPNAVVPNKYASDSTSWEGYSEGEVPSEPYEQKLTVLISYIAPLEMPDKTSLIDGVLWWSPLTGKMYIRYTDQDGTGNWVITNPLGILSSSSSIDYIPEGDGGVVPPPVLPIPQPPNGGQPGIGGGVPYLQKGEQVVWFETLKDFYPGDTINFQQGAPQFGQKQDAVIVKIIEPGSPSAAIIRQLTPDDGEDYERMEIPDGCNVVNVNRALYRVTTEREHLIRKDDLVILSGSAYDELNAEHKIIRGGVVDTAEGETQISNGEVSNVYVTNPGKGYTQNFYVTFYGGGGVGGYAYVEIDKVTSGVKSVVVLDGGINYTTPPKIYWGDTTESNEFEFYTTDAYPRETPSYITSSLAAQSSVAKIHVTSQGVGYRILPTVRGIYKKAIDRGNFKVNLGGTGISDVEVIEGGARYNAPTALFLDLAGEGTGAKAKVTVINGVISQIDITDPGEGYVEPVMYLIEESGKYIALTDNIGQILSMKVLNPGRAISPDRSLKPELLIDTKCIIEFETRIIASVLAPDNYDNHIIGLNGYQEGSIIDTGRPNSEYETMQVGDLVWQGTSDGSVKQVTAEFVSWDPQTQVIELRNVQGVLKQDEWLYNEDGVRGKVLREGQADTPVVVQGIAAPEGKFIDDSSMVSSSYACIQDSYYFQHFSYSISSPLQQHQFDDFVASVIHPAGFIMFSDLSIQDNMNTSVQLLDPIIMGPVEHILSPDAYDTRYTAISPGPGVNLPNPAMSPNTGTIELTRSETSEETSEYVPVEFGPLEIEGYYPLYTTTDGAESAGNGTYHNHTFDGFIYYMPNGVDFWHGNYGEEEIVVPDTQPATPSTPSTPTTPTAPPTTPNTGGSYGSYY